MSGLEIANHGTTREDAGPVIRSGGFLRLIFKHRIPTTKEVRDAVFGSITRWMAGGMAALLVLLVSMSVAQASCVASQTTPGRSVLIGDLPDFFFTPGEAGFQEKTIRYSWASTDVADYNMGDCGIAARTRVPGTAVVATYGSSDVAFSPDLAQVGDSHKPDRIQTYDLTIRAYSWAQRGAKGAIELFVITDDLETCDLNPRPGVRRCNLLLIGRANLYITPPTETSFTVSGSGWQVDIDSPLTNGDPYAKVIVSQNSTPGGSSGVLNNHHVGVWYDWRTSRWAIRNQDGSQIPDGASFNVRIGGDACFVHSAEASNSEGWSTSINDPVANDNPYALVFVTLNENPRASLTRLPRDHPVGVFYSLGRWKIYNMDYAPIAPAHFNVCVMGLPGGYREDQFWSDTGPSKALSPLVISQAEGFAQYKFIVSDDIDGHPDAVLLVTPNGTPPGGGPRMSWYPESPIGVSYWGEVWGTPVDRWAVFRQDQTAMYDMAYNVWKPARPVPSISCGLGVELVLVLAPLMWLRRRRSRSV
jgi:hypothetical protein